MKSAVALVVALVLLAAAWWWKGQVPSGAPKGTPGGGRTSASTPGDEPTAANGEVRGAPVAARPGEFGELYDPPSAADRPRFVQMPGGIWLPALNGVSNPPRSSWNPRRPYAPVTGIRELHGENWYVHADGSYSTTRMVFRGDLGRSEPQSDTLHPVENQTPPRIIDPDGTVRDPIPTDPDPNQKR